MLIHKEATEVTGEHEKGPIMNLVLVASMQRIEHYEIAAYGNTAAMAMALGEENVAGLLQQTLEEEKATDLKLTAITQKSLMSAAMGESMEQVAPAKKRSAA